LDVKHKITNKLEIIENHKDNLDKKYLNPYILIGVNFHLKLN